MTEPQSVVHVWALNSAVHWDLRCDPVEWVRQWWGQQTVVAFANKHSFRWNMTAMEYDVNMFMTNCEGMATLLRHNGSHCGHFDKWRRSICFAISNYWSQTIAKSQSHSMKKLEANRINKHAEVDRLTSLFPLFHSFRRDCPSLDVACWFNIRGHRSTAINRVLSIVTRSRTLFWTYLRLLEHISILLMPSTDKIFLDEKMPTWDSE